MPMITRFEKLVLKCINDDLLIINRENNIIKVSDEELIGSKSCQNVENHNR